MFGGERATRSSSPNPAPETLIPFPSPVRRVRLHRLVRLHTSGTFLTATVLLTVAGWGLQGAALLLRSPVLPPPGALLRVMPALLPTTLPAILPLAALFTWLVTLGRWSRDGTWIALSAGGLPGRHLAGPLLVQAAVLSFLLLLVNHRLAPQGHRVASRELAQAVEEVRLVPGRFVEVGDTVIHNRGDGAVFVWRQGIALGAAHGCYAQTEDGPGLLLERGRALGDADPPATLDFERAFLPLVRSGSSRRIELVERSDEELRTLIGNMRAHGKSAAYEANVLHKRTTLALVPFALALLALPLGLGAGGRPTHAMAVALLYWALIRIGDQLCTAVPPLLGASLPLAGLGLAAATAWLAWRER